METNPLQEENHYETEEFDTEIKKQNDKKPDSAFLLVIFLTGSIICLISGLSSVWPSTAIPKLKSNDTEKNPLGRPITTFEFSMVAGLPTLAMVLGSILHGYLSQKNGRKRSIQIAGVGICISILALAFSTNIICIIIFRCIWSLFSNGGFLVFFIYVTEICEDHNRAKYGCLAGAFIPFGQLVGFSFGAFLNFRNFMFAELSPMLIFFIFFFFAPESPIYNFSKGRVEKCSRSLRKLRRYKNEIELEKDLQSISDTINISKMHRQTHSSVVKLFNSKERRYALMLATAPLLIKVFGGIGIMLPFLEPIFIAAETKYNSSQMPIFVAIFKIAGYFSTSFIVEKFGRKILMIISSVGSGASMIALGCFFHLKYIHSPFIFHLQWFPLACTICYVISFSLGLGSIPLAIMGEYFIPDLRAGGVTFVSTLFSFFLFFSSTSYPYIVEHFGLQWCLWIYSFLSFLGACFIYVVIPENKGKTIKEIQEYIKSCCNKK